MSLVPLNQVLEFDGHTYTPLSTLVDADATPTWAVFQAGNATAIATGPMTRRSLGTYYVRVTASVANGFTLSEQYQAKMSATVGGAVGTQVLARFILINPLQAGRVDSSVGAIAAGLLDAVWAVVAEGSFTALELLRLIAASAVAKLSGAATTTVVIRDVSDTKNRVVAIVDANGNRTAVTVDAS